ncbi:MAG: MFS transporter [Chloroflexota bacterium]|nr:MFS transporter [Chloroflexota bacterium]
MVLFRKGHTSRAPAEYRANFNRLYLDIAGAGMIAGGAMAFVGVFIARQGASTLQVGLLSAGPAVVNLLFSIPAGRWMEGRAVERSVVLTATANRLGYLLWALLPFLLLPQAQVWTIIALVLLMGIPATALVIGFNTLFATAVPDECRGHVAGARNALFAVVYLVTSLGCGQILNILPFPVGYQVVFGLSFLGGLFSTYNLARIKLGKKGMVAPSSARESRLRLDVLRGPFGRVLAVLFAFYLTLYLAFSVIPLYLVNVLRLTDLQISWGAALLSLAMLAGSTQLARVSRRWGHQRVTAFGGLLVACYAGLLALAQGFPLYLVANLFVGFAWGLLGGAMINYVLERAPAADRSASLVWYNLAINAAMLLGSLGGSLAGDWLGLTTALGVFAVLRLAAAFVILKWG